MKSQLYRSIKRKKIKVQNLVVGDIILHGGIKSGAFHKIIKVQGIKEFKNSTRLIFETKFHSIIRNGEVTPHYEKTYDPVFKNKRHVRTVVQIIDCLPKVI